MLFTEKHPYICIGLSSINNGETSPKPKLPQTIEKENTIEAIIADNGKALNSLEKVKNQ